MLKAGEEEEVKPLGLISFNISNDVAGSLFSILKTNINGPTSAYTEGHF